MWLDYIQSFESENFYFNVKNKILDLNTYKSKLINNVNNED